MENTGNLLLVIISAVLGWKIMDRLKVPSAAIFGSMLAVGIVSLLGFQVQHTNIVKPILQVIVGSSLGLRVERDVLLDLKNIIVPAISVSIYIIISTFTLGYIISYSTALDLSTSLISVVPGGLIEMSLTAVSFGAHGPTVAIIQLLRHLSVKIAVPLCIVIKEKKHTSNFHKNQKEISWSMKWLLYYLLIGSTGGFFLDLLGVPAGFLVGSMLALGAFKVLYRKEGSFQFPEQLIISAHIGVGAIIGLSFSPDIFSLMQRVFAPLLLIVVLITGGGLLLGFVLSKMTSWDLTTCLLACAPGGITLMIALADSFQCDAIKVSILQLVRMLTIVIIVIPLLGLTLSLYR